MKYTNRADLLIAAGESIKMQEKAGIEPVCKCNVVIADIADLFFYADANYEFPLAVVEGKAVFAGDELYLGTYNKTVKVSAKHDEYDGLIYSHLNSFGNAGFENFSWNPPKPKTVMVELLVEDADGLICGLGGRVALACRKALGETK